MPRIYGEGNVEAHILYGDEYAQVHCYDKREGEMEVEVVVDLLLLLPVSYGEEPTAFPTPAFTIEAMQSVLRHHQRLLEAWEKISKEF